MLTHNISVPIEGGSISCTIYMPPKAKVIVLISHALGSGRFNLRNRKLAEQFENAGLATLFSDWNDMKKTKGWEGHFDPVKIAQALDSIIRWVKNHRKFKHLSPTLFGSDSGAACALIAASQTDDSVKALVSRNGRLELAEQYLHKVKTPAFIAVGNKDYHMLEKTKKAFNKLACPKELAVIKGITPFLEEPKEVERLERLAIKWIKKHSLPETTVCC